ncbi:MAG: SDR family oxidoreductase [Rhizobiaceae bacterium]|nr:SDR family oxidoreductase [Rhizobiaceae bacterium]
MNETRQLSMRLKDRVAMVSGASRNIGRTIAHTLAREGAHVVLVANKSGEELKRVAAECEEFGVRALPVFGDVSKSADVNRMVAEGLSHFGKIDILASVAGIRPNRPFWEVSDEEWHQVMAVNMYATFYLARALAPSMMERRTGNIVALGGMSSLTAGTNRAAVGASKTGLRGLVRSLALELGPYGIRANMVAPGLIDTERLNPEWYPAEGADLGKPGRGGESTPLGRKGTPQDIADAVLYLTSDESAYITGDCLIVAGGAYM